MPTSALEVEESASPVSKPSPCGEAASLREADKVASVLSFCAAGEESVPPFSFPIQSTPQESPASATENICLTFSTSSSLIESDRGEREV